MHANLRIAILSPVFPPYRGGIATVAYNHARLLADRGQEVVVFTPDYQRVSEAETRSSFPASSAGRQGEGWGEGWESVNFQVKRLKPALKYGNAAWLPGLGKKLKDFDAVILEYPFFGAMQEVCQAKKKYGLKLVLSYNMDLIGLGWKKLIFDWHKKNLFPKLVSGTDLIFASSHDYAKHSSLGKFWQDNNSKFQVLPYGVDISRFVPITELSQPSPQLPPWQAGGRIILFVGGLDKTHYFKGVDNLIRALPFVKEKNYRLVIAGGGNLLEHYQQVAKQTGASEKIRFAGKVSDEVLIKLYQQAYVTVLPATDQSESFGIVLVESMACATPVIASDLPGVRSVFVEGETGFKIKANNVQSLADKLNYVIEHEDEIERMRPQARQLVEEKYDWEKIGDRLLKIIPNRPNF